MRVLWLSPWMRTLARVHCEGLHDLGADVLLLTSDQHPQPLERQDWELVLDPRPKTARTWPEFAKSLAVVRKFRPEVVVSELVRDPRWLAFGLGIPRVNLIHDNRPHDPDEERPSWERALFNRWGAASAATLCFSEYVRIPVAAAMPGHRVQSVPLTSDLPQVLVPPFVPAEQRRDFVMVGRLNGYKNLPAVLRAWDRHVRSDRYRGDTLRLLGTSDLDLPKLPPNTVWHNESYDYRDVISVLAHAKGSVAFYLRATQSGVQVLSQQLGVMPIISTEGALPEFQPAQFPALDSSDIEGLATAFGHLADPETAVRMGAVAMRHYEERYHARIVAQHLHDRLNDVIGHR